MTPMDELGASQVLGQLEKEYEQAQVRYAQAWSWGARNRAWERIADLATHIRGHCAAYHLIPSVDVGSLRG